MKNWVYVGLAIAMAAGITACAKSESSSNAGNIKAFNAWMKVFHKEALGNRTALGSYILEDEPGEGELVGDADQSPYVMLDYTVEDLNGNIQATTYENVAQRLGTYDETSYYGMRVSPRANNATFAGLDEILTTMKIGGRRRVAIPGWLNTTSRYSDSTGYQKNVTGENYVYDVRVVDAVDNIVQWELDSLHNYFNRHFPGADTLGYSEGIMHKELIPATDTNAFDDGATVYLDYVARLLNGRVFDTTIKDTATKYGLSGGTYEPVYVSWSEDYTNITMGEDETSVINGFAFALTEMRTGQRCAWVFYSGHGYGEDGSGDQIPPYSPLRFDIQVYGTENPE